MEQPGEAFSASPVGRLAEVLQKLGRVQEPSEVVYGDVPIPTAEPPAGVTEDYSVTVARRVSTILGRLSELSKSNRQRVLTPRGVLLELMDIVQHGLFLSLPREMRHVGQDHASLASSYQTYVSSRCIPVEAMMEGLHSLTYVSVKLRVELVTLQLRRRIDEEVAAHREEMEAAGVGGRGAARSMEEELAALLVTEKLLDDFVEVFHNALLITPVVAAAVGASMRSPVSTALSSSSGGMAPGSSQLLLPDPSALAALLPTLERYYYQMGDWIMLTSNATTVSPISLTSVTKVTLHEKNGLVECEFHRPDTSQPWGLLFNERGYLIGVDASIRVTGKARELEGLLRCSQNGARVTAVNGVSVKPAKKSSASAPADDSTATLQAVQAASLSRKRLALTLRSASFKKAMLHSPAELVFSCPAQGGEGASGQRASFLFHRFNTRAPWQFAIDADLMWFPPPPKLLSESACAFVRRFPHRLRVLAVNGVEVQSPEQMRDMVGQVEVLLLELVVVPVEQSAARGDKARSRGVAEGAKTEALPESPQTTAAAASTTHQVKPTDVAAIEQQVREATQRLMLSHAQQEELREVPVVDLAGGAARIAEGGEPFYASANEEKESTTATAAAAAAGAPTEVDIAAEAILQEMLKEAGVDAGDGAENALSPAQPKRTEANAIEDSTAPPEPCLFENAVRLLSFDGRDMVFHRASQRHPWGIKVSQNTTAPEATDARGDVLSLRVLALPVPLPASAAHPFLRRFTSHKGAWLIESINGKAAATDPRAALERMRKATRMCLRVARFS